jgi:hypothetical protein
MARTSVAAITTAVFARVATASAALGRRIEAGDAMGLTD